jgi:hypothetical protein
MFVNLNIRPRVVVVVLATVFVANVVVEAGDRPLTFETLMKFR